MWESLLDYGRSTCPKLRTPHLKALDIATPNFFEKTYFVGGGASNYLYHEGAPHYMDLSQSYHGHGHFKLGNFH